MTPFNLSCFVIFVKSRLRDLSWKFFDTCRSNRLYFLPVEAGDYKTARKEFKYLKDDMLESCWRNMKFFEKAKKEVFANEEADLINGI